MTQSITHPSPRKARAVGFNHVALEVGSIDEALEFYGKLFDIKLRSRSDTDAFIDLGDQFLALQSGRKQSADDGRHFGLVVDDKEAVRAILEAEGVEILPGRFLDFLDPWGNQIMLWAHLDGVEVDPDTHEVIGETPLPEGWTIE